MNTEHQVLVSHPQKGQKCRSKALGIGGRVLLEAPSHYRPGLPSFIGPKWFHPKIQRKLQVLLRFGLQARRRK